MRRILFMGLAVAIVPVGVAVAQSDGLKVTGGGQVIASGSSGPGDTIGFNAQQTGEPEEGDDFAPAKGQLQVIQRDPSGGGKPQVNFHGTVTCIRELIDDQGDADPSNDQRFVRFGGNGTAKGQSGAVPFTVDTQDNGEGLNATGTDMILFRQRGSTEDPCDDSDPDTQLRTTTLSRGNVQEH